MDKKKALRRMKSFNARGSTCPICKRNFRNGCGHTVIEARERLNENYIKSLR